MKNKFMAGLLTGTIAGIIIFIQLGFWELPSETTRSKHNKELREPKLPASMQLFGEEVPLNRYDVQEDLDREFIYNYNHQAHMTYLLKLAHRFFPVIEQRLKQNNVPDDFKYLCVAEGNLQNMISKSGATGYWQFMRATAPAYGLEINKNVDERYNLIRSTDAACKYLKLAYSRFGNWTAAAASYNCGMAGFEQAAKFQGTMNYYDLQLPEETNKYIFRIAALKYIISNAPALGLNLDESDKYKDVAVKTLIIDKPIADLSAFARSNGITYKSLVRFNPWLRGRSLQIPNGKSYEIRLPLK